MIKLKTDAERDPMYIEIIPSLKLIDNANREWLICMFHMIHMCHLLPEKLTEL